MDQETTITTATRLCTFCGKSDAVVGVIIEGPGVRICDECVDYCAVIVADHRNSARSHDIQPIPGLGSSQRQQPE